ncbi:hypothetical protein D3C81_2080950 [compost metagenome]
MAAVGGLDDHAAGDHGIELLGLALEPLVGRSVLGLGQAFGVHGKAGGEHLREDDQVSAAGLLQQGFEMLIVGQAVLPDQAGLHQRDVQVGQATQIAHSFSAA